MKKDLGVPVSEIPRHQERFPPLSFPLPYPQGYEPGIERPIRALLFPPPFPPLWPALTRSRLPGINAAGRSKFKNVLPPFFFSLLSLTDRPAAPLARRRPHRVQGFL